MRIRAALFGSILLLVGFVRAADATTVSFTGTLGFQIGGDGDFSIRPVELSGSGVATLNGSGGGVHLSSLSIPAAAFVGNPSVVIYNAAPVSGLLLASGFSLSPYHTAASNSVTMLSVTGSASNSAGSFANLSNSANNLAGTMPLSGVGIVCLFDPCSGLPFLNLVVPLSVVGQGGTATVQGVLINQTVIGAPWLKNTAAVNLFTPTSIMGFAHGPASATQSTTAQASGVLSLVTPVSISTSLQTLALIAGFARVTVHFAPEPSAMLLLGVGAAAFTVLVRRRQRATTRE